MWSNAVNMAVHPEASVGEAAESDICLVLEGTYPYVSGGVSSWTHNLIRALPERSFHLVTLLPRNADTTLRYDLPENVTGITPVVLQVLPERGRRYSRKAAQSLCDTLEMPLLNMQSHGTVKHFRRIIDALHQVQPVPGQEMLLDSEASWNMLLRMYHAAMGDSCFLDYFWSWRALLGGLFSVLLSPLPKARCYHALCTGYAGIYLARAGIETGRPCLLTEHGIYTNERRIEIALADWLEDDRALSMSTEDSRRSLRDFWMDTFISYSRVCYAAATETITLYQGNTQFQLMDDADPERLHIVPNGVDVERFASLPRHSGHPPTVALIGRVVPIKDIRSFIRACSMLQEHIPDLRALIIGPQDEDPEYYASCQTMVEKLDLFETVEFTGKVDITQYLPEIDVLVLTSLSEAQPLVILEAGAAGIPVVATDVGACREMILGREDEDPAYGDGGVICPLSNAQAVAEAIQHLLLDKEFYDQCSRALKQRVERYYRQEDQYRAYRERYDRYCAADEIAVTG